MNIIDCLPVNGLPEDQERAVALLALVAGQDVEPGEPPGEPVLAHHGIFFVSRRQRSAVAPVNGQTTWYLGPSGQGNWSEEPHMPVDWKPIQRGKVDVRGIDQEHPELLDVVVPVSRIPEPEWRQFFLHSVGVDVALSMRLPELEGTLVRLTPPDAELQQYVSNMDDRISAANERYQREVLAERRAEEDRKQQTVDDTQRRIREARRRAEDL